MVRKATIPFENQKSSDNCFPSFPLFLCVEPYERMNKEMNEWSELIYNEFCLQKVQPLLIEREQFVRHQCNLAAKESGLECACMNNDNFTVLVSGGSRHL